MNDFTSDTLSTEGEPTTCLPNGISVHSDETPSSLPVLQHLPHFMMRNGISSCLAL